MALALVLVPFGFGLLLAVITSNRLRPLLVLVGALVECCLMIAALSMDQVVALDGWLVLDPLARLVLSFCLLLFLACAAYLQGYLRHHANKPNRVFCASSMAFLGGLVLVALAQHLGLLWVAMEASTLAAAPMLYFHRSPRSLEAMWKYLLVGSVGIALALFGSFLLGYAALVGGAQPSLLLSDLLPNAPSMSPAWLHPALLVLLVGYGTKMGLAPLHTWKPDAYGEAPGLVGALFAGGLTSAAFLAILRVQSVAVAAGEGAFLRTPLVVLGLLSMFVAGAFMLRQRDYKRLLAYSSIEHMGILALGIGIGGGAVFGALLHMLNNALAKGAVFLAAGSIHRELGAKSVDEAGGALRVMPHSALLLLLGFFALSGLPPFGLFISELTIVTAAVDTQQYWVAGLLLTLLAFAFVGMARTVLDLVQGDPRPVFRVVREHWRSTLPSACLLGLVVLLGVFVPEPLRALLQAAAATVEGR